MGITQRTGAIKMNIDLGTALALFLFIPIGILLWLGTLIVVIDVIKNLKR